MSARWWAEAIKHATWIWNRTLHRGKTITPFEEFWGVKPDVDQVPIFGTEAWMLIPEETGRQKLDDRGRKITFIGMADRGRSYRLCDRATGQIFESRDVRFPAPDEIPLEFLRRSAVQAQPPQVGQSGDPEDGDFAATSSDDDSQEGESPGDPANGRSSGAAVEESDGAESAEGERNRLEGEQSEAEETGRPKRNRRTTLFPEEAMRLTPNQEWERVHRRSKATFGLSASASATAFIADSNGVEIVEPASFREALQSPQREGWLLGMGAELLGLIENETFTLERLPEGTKTIGTKWVLVAKIRSDGTLERYKGRIVARGFRQVKGLNFTETFAPVAKIPTVRYCLALSSNPKIFTAHTDVKQAYLNGKLEHVIYIDPVDGMDQILEFVLGGETLEMDPELRRKAEKLLEQLRAGAGRGRRFVLRLHKALYGLKQAGREWWKLLDEVLTRMGFTSHPSDPCLYVKVTGSGIWIIVLVYVDDLAWFGSSREAIDREITELSKKFKISNMGELRWFLSMRIQRSPGITTVDQGLYVADLLGRYRMDDCTAAATPVNLSEKLSKDMEAKTTAEKALMPKVPYANAVGELMFLANFTRPDIQYAVSQAAKYMQNPGPKHWEAVKRILRYLQGTRNYGLQYEYAGPDAQVTGYCDADWGMDRDNGKSITGMILKFHGAAIAWKSKQQTTVAKSSTEAEMYAANVVMTELVWIRQILEHVKMAPPRALKLYSDSQGALALAEGEGTRADSKHYAVRIFFVRDHLRNGQVKMEYLSTDKMPADGLTKGLGPVLHKRMCEMIGVRPIVTMSTTSQRQDRGGIGRGGVSEVRADR